MKPQEKTQFVVSPSIATTIPNRNIVIFDPGVENWESLAAGVIPGTEVVILHPQQDGVAQIAELLENCSNIEALHIVSHGSPGCLYLGSVLLNTDNLESYNQTLGQWRNALSGKADILLYGCEVAAGEIGESFVQRLSEITGAEIAASDDPTGNAALGGDWELEVRTGDINTPLVFVQETIAEYPGVLTREPEWIKQFGTTFLDTSKGITVDSAGNIYITGETGGNLGGINAGSNDAWVAKYDSSVTQQWVQQLGTTENERSNGITVDSAGNLYITGDTVGNLGGTNAGNYDAWVAKYDNSGTQQWVQQLGSSLSDYSNGITVDSAGNLYITGYTDGNLGGTDAGRWDAWVAKYDSSGTQQWVQQLGTTENDASKGITVDSAGNIYITGWTDGSLGGTSAGTGAGDAWVAKYDSSGTQQWVQQFGSFPSDSSSGITVDSAGNLYITGYTYGNLGGTNAGNYDAWVAKYDSSGTQQWVQQFGSPAGDFSNGITVDSAGNLYITGYTLGNLGGINAGSDDAWVAKYDSSGTQQWIQQLGTTSNDSSNGITIDSAGNPYITGLTVGILGDTSAGGSDAWIAKLSPVVTITPGITPNETAPTTGTFILTLTEPALVGGVTVNYTVAGTATSGTDYTALSGSAVITAGSTTATIDLVPIDDGVYEPDETVEITLTPGTGYVVQPSTSNASHTLHSTGVSIAAGTAANKTVPTNGTFNLTLTEPAPAGGMTVNYTVAGTATNGTDYTALSGSVLIPGGSTTATIDLLPIDDGVYEPDETVEITLVAGTDYDLVAGSETASHTLHSTGVSIAAGTPASETGPTNGTFNLTLTEPAPLGGMTVNYTVAGTATSGSDYTALSGSVFIPAGNTTATIDLVPTDDFLDEGDETVELSLVAGTDYDLVSGSETATLTITDNDIAGVIIAETGSNTAASEDGITDTYSIKLATEPTTSVNIAVTPDTQTDLGSGAGTAVTLTFDSSNWNTEQTVTVTAIDDTAVEYDHTSTISHSVTSTDANYNGLTVTDVTVSLTDNDWPSVSIAAGANPSETSATPGNFQITLSDPAPSGGITLTYSVAGTATSAIDYTALSGSLFIAEGATSGTIQVVPTDDAIADPNETVQLTLNAGTNYNVNAASATASLTVTDNDTAGVTVSAINGNTSEAAGTASFEVVLDTQPTGEVTVNLVSSNTAEGTVSVPSITFTPGNWNVPQTVTVTGVDDNVADGNITYTIQTTVTSTDSIYSSINPNDVSVTNIDNDTPNILVTQSGGSTAVTEGGTTDTYQLVLTTAPTANVNITITPDVQTDLGNGAGTAVTLTFNNTNWNNPQTITVTATDDTAVEYAHTSTISHSVTSTDADYNGMAVSNITANVTDNDLPTVNVAAGNNASETNTSSGQFTLTLSDGAPTGGMTVNYSVAGTATSGTDYTALSGSVFIPAGATTANINVTPLDDAIDEPDETVQLTVATGTGYNLGTTSEATISLADNDTAGAKLTQSNNSTNVAESGTTDTYEIVLLSQPTQDVRITVNPDSQTRVVGETSLIFTSNNWNVPQTVTVGAIDDTAVEYPHSGTISHSITSSDANYNGMSLSAVTANIADNDWPTIGIAPGISPQEQGPKTGTFNLTLSDPAPVEGIRVSYSFRGNATSGIDYNTLSGSVFIPAGATSANINIVPVDDFIDEDDESLEVSLNPGANHNIGSSGTGITHVIDNDTAGIRIVESGSGTEVTEGGSADTYTVVLSSQPTADVRIDFSTDANLNPIQSLTFNASNWNVPQTVSVSAVDDTKFQGDRTIAIAHTVSSSDAKYNGMTLPNINAYIRDSDLAQTTEGLNSGFSLLELFLDAQLSQLTLPVVNKSLQDILPSDFAQKLRMDIVGAVNDVLDGDTEELAGKLQEKLSFVFSEVEVDREITEEEVKFTISGTNTIDLATIPLDGTLGFPALGINAQGSADTAFEYELSLGFGYHKDYGFYFDTENTALGVSLGLGLSDDFKATGTAGFLQLDLENNADDPTEVGAEFKVNLNDIDNAIDDGERLTFSELQGDYNLTDLFSTSLDTKANLGLKAVTSIEGSAAIPSFNFDLKAEFPVLKYEDGEWSGPQKPTLAFNNMQLDLGTFVTDFAKPILTTINDVVEPARPVIDALNKDISFLSQMDALKKIFDQNSDGKVTLVEAGATIAGKKVDTRFLDGMDKIPQVIDLVKEISGQEGTLKIDLGSYEVGVDTTDPNADLTEAETTTTEEASSPTQQAQSKASGTTSKFLSALQNIEGLSFPILSDPGTAIDLLLGKPDVTLFAYQTPKLDLDFGFQQEFPIYSILGIGINGHLGGSFNVKSNLGFGFDTYGLNQWKNAGFALADSYQIFDGFYVSDTENADGTGADVNELKLTATLSAGANISAAVVKAYLTGGVQGTAKFDLLDVGEENGTSDGKVRGSEIISRISDPMSMFEINGTVDAFLDAGVDYWTFWDGWETAWSKRLGTYNLAEFRLGSGPTRRSRAIDGYISGGTVFFDANFNGVWDAEVEPFGITNPDGSFDLMVELEKFDTNGNGEIDVTEGKIVMENGIDVSTYLPLVTPLTSTFDATVVTPLTTLIAQLVEQGIDPTQAQANVEAALGLPAGVDLQNYDPLEAMANGDANGLTVFASMIQVQNTIVQTAKLIEGVSEIPLTQLGNAAIKAIANRLSSGTPVDLTQPSEIEALVNSAIAFAAEAEPTLNSSQLATVASAASQIMALANQRVGEIVSSGKSLTDAATEIARLQSVAQGEIATSLPELAAGTVSVEQFLAQNTREAILEKMGNAFAKDPTMRPIFPDSTNNPIDFTEDLNLPDSPGGPILPQELAASSEGVNRGDSNTLAQNPLDFNMNLFLRFFDAEYYLAQNTDVAEAVGNGTFGSAAEHFGAFGFAEGRAPNELFDTEYLSQYTDVAEAVTNGTFRSGFEHFIKFGFAEGRFPSDVFKDLEMFYLWKNPDAATSVSQGSYANGLEHLVAVELASGGNTLSTYEVLAQTFDSQYYLMQNADVAQAVENGIFRSGMEHFIGFGMVEGRTPSMAYSDSYYLANHADVDEAVKNGIFRSGYEHYMMYGMAEGRIGGEMVGSATSDIILGTAGSNTIAGMEGDDILFGDAGHDILIGVNVNAANPGVGEVDRLIGDRGRDTFVLGDATRTYYNSGVDAETGLNDYAAIADFAIGEDQIQLHGSAADYRLAASPEEMFPGMAIYRKEGDHEDLIAIVQDVSDLNLQENYFSFV
ncbi:SBBP repeat-containing protein [Oscillatoria sp. HE19RPO]|uniref:SBBP repeat-containing protein n=1 Tax=Oscillatoria sp. HE19RPO TaxID=2954806 RepID=UPI0020C2F8DE|nr:SBBP repeat-containing protein [Oscillatoria sp. HE19RPO]